ncbi:hypothetical protein LCGC14_1332900, partial [marine sediment metagenome]
KELYNIMTKKEIKIQEALGVAKRYKVIIYHDVMGHSSVYQIGTCITYNTIIVFAKQADDACRFVYNKYSVKNITDTSVDASVYKGCIGSQYCCI